MVNEAPARPGSARNETWRAWKRPAEEPEPQPHEMLSHDEILAYLRKIGVPSTPRGLRQLQDRGLLPLATLHRRDGRRLGLFPRWVAELAGMILVLRREGLSWEEIRRQVPTRERPGPVLGDAATGQSVRLPAELLPGIEAIGDWFSREIEPVAEIRLTLIDRDGFSWPFTLRPKPDGDPA